MNLFDRFRERLFDRKFPGFGTVGVEVSGNTLAVEYFRTPLIQHHKKKEIPIGEIRSMVFWEADRFKYCEVSCRIEWSGGAFVVGDLDRGFYDFLTVLEERYDQTDVSKRVRAGEVVTMIEDGEPVGRIF